VQTDFPVNNSSSLPQPLRVAIIGGGPAGLMAAEVLAGAGPAVSVRLYDAMPSVGRKFCWPAGAD
jgi:predicted flavoprotein YhiN